MEGIFAEFENENANRSYPFASGCVVSENDEAEIPADVFIDAVIYPINPTGRIYLSEISEDGTYYVSDDSGVIMSGKPSGAVVELYDTSELARHVGTLVSVSSERLAEFSGRGSSRHFSAESAAFSSSCVFPVVIDGVTTVSVGGLGKMTGTVCFENAATDDVRVSSTTRTDGKKTLRFDILPRPGAAEGGSIRRIICVVDGQTPFRIEKLAYNTILLRMEGVDKGIVCSAAHRENQFEMVDTCDCGKDPLPTKDELPEAYQLEEVFIPPDEAPGHPEGGLDEGAENAFYLVVSNVLGYDNPISITLEDGAVAPKTDDLKTVVKGTNADLADGEMLVFGRTQPRQRRHSHL